MTAAELEALAEEQGFNSFEGEGYSGYGDDFVEFGGHIRSFLEKQSGSGRIFTMTIKNQTNADQNIILMPAYTSEGQLPGSVVITDGQVEVAPGQFITTSGRPKTVQNFLDFVKLNPTLMLGFKIKTSSNSLQLDQDVLVRELSPFKTLGDRTIPLSTYQDENTFQNLVVTVPEEIVAGNQTEVSITILQGEQLTWSWFIGAILNTQVSLSRKASKAKHTGATMKAKKVMPKKA